MCGQRDVRTRLAVLARLHAGTLVCACPCTPAGTVFGASGETALLHLRAHCEECPSQECKGHSLATFERGRTPLDRGARLHPHLNRGAWRMPGLHPGTAAVKATGTDSYRLIMDSLWTRMDSVWTRYGLVWTRYGLVMDSLWTRYGLVMDSVWTRYVPAPDRDRLLSPGLKGDQDRHRGLFEYRRQGVRNRLLSPGLIFAVSGWSPELIPSPPQPSCRVTAVGPDA